MAVADNANGTPADDRRIRAATEAMIVAPIAPGMFEVFSGTRGRYVVDVLDERCECDDYRFRQSPEGRCKHLWRALQSIGEEPVPEGVRIDSTLAINRGLER